MRDKVTHCAGQFQPIPGLIGCAEVTGKWCMLVYSGDFMYTCTICVQDHNKPEREMTPASGKCFLFLCFFFLYHCQFLNHVDNTHTHTGPTGMLHSYATLVSLILTTSQSTRPDPCYLLKPEKCKGEPNKEVPRACPSQKL